MQHNYAFHLGLHCLLRLRRSSEKEMQFYLEIIMCHPSIYTMNQPKLICTISDGRAHQHTCVSIDWWRGLKHGMFSAPYLHQGEKSDFAFFITLLYAKNKGTDQHAHPRSLISVFVFSVPVKCTVSACFAHFAILATL